MTANAPTLRSTQIILLALAMGVLTFAGVVVFLRLSSSKSMDPDLGNLLLVTIGGLAVSEIVVYVLLRRSFVARAAAARDESLQLLRQDRIPPSLQVLAILGAALAEGAGLLGVVALLLGAPWVALAVPVVAVALILVQMPTRERLERLVREG
jgi:hypothetical protein